MKSAVIFLILSAVSAQAQTWSPSVSPAAAKAAAHMAISPAKALPADKLNYSGAEEVLRKEYFLPSIIVDFPEAEVGKQLFSYHNSFCLEQALRLALESLVYDYSDPTGPLAGVLSSMGAAKPTKEQARQASERLLRQMNDPGSFIQLIATAYSAPRGETTAGNWLFRLGLKGSKTYYWAVVDRSGSKPAYNYGAD